MRNTDVKDWRLTPGHERLRGERFVRKPWHASRVGWDHDHCEFCWRKFPDDEPEGWTAAGPAGEPDYHWVCDACFADFREPLELVAGPG
jgi:hypothetical protein